MLTLFPTFMPSRFRCSKHQHQHQHQHQLVPLTLLTPRDLCEIMEIDEHSGWNHAEETEHSLDSMKYTGLGNVLLN